MYSCSRRSAASSPPSTLSLDGNTFRVLSLNFGTAIVNRPISRKHRRAIGHFFKDVRGIYVRYLGADIDRLLDIVDLHYLETTADKLDDVPLQSIRKRFRLRILASADWYPFIRFVARPIVCKIDKITMEDPPRDAMEAMLTQACVSDLEIHISRDVEYSFEQPSNHIKRCTIVSTGTCERSIHTLIHAVKYGVEDLVIRTSRVNPNELAIVNECPKLKVLRLPCLTNHNTIDQIAQSVRVYTSTD